MFLSGCLRGSTLDGETFELYSFFAKGSLLYHVSMMLEMEQCIVGSCSVFLESDVARGLDIYGVR